MQIKRIVMMAVAGCAIGMLTGCGVPQEEHDAMIAQLKTERAEMEDKLNGTIADKESLLKAEQAKVRTARIELDDASERIKDFQKKNAEMGKEIAGEKGKVADLESQLSSAKSATMAARDLAQEAEDKYNTLNVEYQELKRRFEMFQKNLSALDQAQSGGSMAPVGGTPASSAEPKSDSEAAMDILNQMGTK